MSETGALVVGCVMLVLGYCGIWLGYRLRVNGEPEFAVGAFYGSMVALLVGVGAFATVALSP